MMFSTKSLALAIVTSFLLCTPAAGDMNIAPQRAYIVDMPLADVISWFEGTNGLIVRADQASMAAQVAAKEVDFELESFLLWLQREYDLSYYMHGDTIYLSSSQDNIHRIVYLDELTVVDVKVLLEEYGLRSSMPVSGQNIDGSDDRDGNVAILAGPLPFVEIAEGIIAKVESDLEIPATSVSIMRAAIRMGDDAVNHHLPNVAQQTNETQTLGE